MVFLTSPRFPARRTRWNPVTVSLNNVEYSLHVLSMRALKNSAQCHKYHTIWALYLIHNRNWLWPPCHIVQVFTHHSCCTCNYAKKKVQSTNMSTDSYTRKMSSCGRLVIWIYNSNHACAIISSFNYTYMKPVHFGRVTKTCAHLQTSCNAIQCCGYCTKPNWHFLARPVLLFRGAPTILHSL